MNPNYQSYLTNYLLYIYIHSHSDYHHTYYQLPLTIHRFHVVIPNVMNLIIVLKSYNLHFKLFKPITRLILQIQLILVHSMNTKVSLELDQLPPIKAMGETSHIVGL